MKMMLNRLRRLHPAGYQESTLKKEWSGFFKPDHSFFKRRIRVS